MSTSPVTTITDELIAELDAAANYCVTEVIRSHSWSEQEFDLLCADERYVRAASPELVVALLAERAELKRDAGRYRWLRDQAMSTGGDCPVVMMLDDCLEPANGAKTSSALELEDLDAAIDAAMSSAAQ